MSNAPADYGHFFYIGKIKYLTLTGLSIYATTTDRAAAPSVMEGVSNVVWVQIGGGATEECWSVHLFQGGPLESVLCMTWSPTTWFSNGPGSATGEQTADIYLVTQPFSLAPGSPIPAHVPLFARMPPVPYFGAVPFLWLPQALPGYAGVEVLGGPYYGCIVKVYDALGVPASTLVDFGVDFAERLPNLQVVTGRAMP